ncbi:MAG TPA: HEAT repeat domain-containing protein [Gemmataceae bacterium]|jgi:HEAT repeat protein
MNRFLSRLTVGGLALTALLAGLARTVPAEGDRKLSPEQIAALRKSLKDPATDVRSSAALALAEAHDAEAIPVLIDLLADLDAVKRAPVEEFLTQLAGEWAPVVNFPSDDKIARKIRRDAWLAWWKNTNGEALLEALREHTLTNEARRKVRDLLSRLGSDDFGKREVASRDLFALGRITLPQLREALKDKDAEVARRAKLLIDRIEREPAHRLPAAAVRLLGVRKPDGAAAALLAYLPHAEEETQSEEVRKALTSLASRGGKVEPALVAALSDERALVRAAAAEALASGGGTAGRAEARKLLQDKSSSVRLKTALALVRARDKEGVPVLIALLTELSAEEVGSAEDALYQLAGDSAPKETPGVEAAERKKYREAWSAWWKANAERVDLAKLTDRPWYGYTLICDASRVYELDRHGKQRWTLDVPSPIDAVVVARDRVLVAEWGNNRITERDMKNNIVWQKRVGSNPTNVQRLPNGNTFIATTTGGLVEVDRTGKEVYTINNLPTNVLAAYRSPRGPVVCLLGNGQCVFMDTAGKQLQSFACPGNGAGCIDVLPNGGILVVRGNKVAEYDSGGKKLRELDAVNPTTPTGMPNGHVLVSSQGGNRVVELDRAGKVVWEHKGVACYRARQR